MLTFWRSAKVREQVFSKWPSHVTNDSWLKDPFRVQDRPMNFNVTEQAKLVNWDFLKDSLL